VTTLIATAWAELEAALRERHTVRLTYHGNERTLCPHALGWKNGRAMLLGYQAGGWTSTGMLDADPAKRWRCLFVDEVTGVVAEPGESWQSADNYDPDNPFRSIDVVALAVRSEALDRRVR
jgi:hypothetical protein